MKQYWAKASVCSRSVPLDHAKTQSTQYFNSQEKNCSLFINIGRKNLHRTWKHISVQVIDNHIL